MYKVKIFSIGKNKEPWLKLALDEYTRRLQPILSIIWIFAKNDEHLSQMLEKEPSFIVFDANGEMLSSKKFSPWLINTLQNQGARLSLVIGGPEGLSEQIRERAKRLMSLSRLTFTHQLTRLIVLEQLYRALEIHRGSAYHK